MADLTSKITRIATGVGDQAALIEQIKAALEGKAAGGGGGAQEIYTGEFTVASDVSGLPTNQGSAMSYIDTGRTDNPWLYAYWQDGDYPGTYGFCAMIAVKANEYDYYRLATSNYTSSSSKYSGAGAFFPDTSSLVGTASLFASSTSVKLYAGYTYKWLAIYEGATST